MVDFQFVDTLPQDVGDIYKNLIDGDFVSFWRCVVLPVFLRNGGILTTYKTTWRHNPEDPPSASSPLWEPRDSDNKS
jgi:hypothetical protein